MKRRDLFRQAMNQHLPDRKNILNTILRRPHRRPAILAASGPLPQCWLQCYWLPAERSIIFGGSLMSASPRSLRARSSASLPPATQLCQRAPPNWSPILSFRCPCGEAGLMKIPASYPPTHPRSNSSAARSASVGRASNPIPSPVITAASSTARKPIPRC